MTEAELFEAGQIAFSNCLAAFAIYVTMLSGYLVMVYVIGDKMTRSQIVIINTLYSILTITIIAAFISFALIGHETSQLAFEMTEKRRIGPLPIVAEVATVALIFCFIASLRFTWDVRHNREK